LAEIQSGVQYGVDMTNSVCTAVKIAQMALEGTDVAINEGNFLAFLQHFEIPHLMEINGKTETLSTVAHLKEVFDRFREHLWTNRVTTIERHIISAGYIGQNSIHTTHETRLVSGSQLIAEAYPVYSVLQNISDHWQIVSSKTEFPDTSRLSFSLVGDIWSTAKLID